MTWSCAPGPSRTPLRSTAASTSSATSTSGRGRCKSRTRRSGSPAAARSRPGSGARRWTTSTPTCPISASRTGAPRCRASGTRWRGSARTGTRTAPVFCNLSASPRTAKRRCELYKRAGRVFLWPLPARRPALGDAARLHHRSDAARRHPRARSAAPRSLDARQAGARDDRHQRHRRARLCHHRLARRGRRTTDRGRDRPQCRPSDAAACSSAAWARNWRPTTPSCSPIAYCRSSRVCSPNGRTAGGRSRWPAPSAPPFSRHCWPPPNSAVRTPAPIAANWCGRVRRSRRRGRSCTALSM